MTTKSKDKLNSSGLKSEWGAKLKKMNDDQLFSHCEQFIWLSAYAANNPRSDYHWLCDAGYHECHDRDKIDLYSRAHDRASGKG